LASLIVGREANLLSFSARLPNNRPNQPFPDLSDTQKYAQGRKNTFSAFLVLLGSQPANDSSFASKKQPKTNSSKHTHAHIELTTESDKQKDDLSPFYTKFATATHAQTHALQRQNSPL
jgi:hypothetical protein